ncbi:MAG: right-handed parallel beta-helix repeat-containing protein [Trueperaceae bacterium]
MIAAALVIVLTPQDVRVSNAAEFRQAVANAKPGQRILVAPGEYRGGFGFSGLNGTSERKIVIAGAEPTNRPRFSGIQFSRISHVEIRDIVIDATTGNGINIDDGGSIDQPSHHVLLENVFVLETPKGNIDGIKLSGVGDFQVKGCTIERWGGSGIDMVGCHRGVIEGCTFQNGGDNGVQGKGGTSDVVVRRCLFENAGQRAVNLGGSTGMQFFRPALAKMPANAKYEAKNLTVEGCIFIGSAAPIAFVGVNGAVVRFNTIYMPERWAVRILQETVSPEFVPSRNGVFTDNIVVFRSDKWASGGVNVGPNTAPQTFRFERNWWYCTDRPANSTPQLSTKETNGTYGTDPQFVDAANGDLRLKPTSPAQGAGAGALNSALGG